MHTDKETNQMLKSSGCDQTSLSCDMTLILLISQELV